MTRILITGGTGFIGFNLARHLQDNDLFITGAPGENPPVGKMLGHDFSRLPWHDLCGIDVLYHLAACADTTNLDWQYQLQTNSLKSYTLFRQAIAHGVRRIVYASSCSVYGDVYGPFHEDGPVNPLNPYAASKLMLDGLAGQLATETGATVIGLRFSNVYGEGERHKRASASMLSQIGWAMQEGHRPKLFRDGQQRRDWVSVEDAIQGLVLAGTRPGVESGVYNIGAGVSVSFRQVVAIWNGVLGTDIEPEYVPNPHEGRYQTVTEVDISKAKKGISYVPKFSVKNVTARL